MPGRLTTAFLVARLALPAVRGGAGARSTRCSTRVAAGDVDAGVVIHEGQLGWQDAGLSLVVDLGAWWLAETGLPLPLGAVAIRRDLPADDAAEVSAVLLEAIDAGLANRAGGARLRPGLRPRHRRRDRTTASSACTSTS